MVTTNLYLWFDFSSYGQNQLSIHPQSCIGWLGLSRAQCLNSLTVCFIIFMEIKITSWQIILRGSYWGFVENDAEAESPGYFRSSDHDSEDFKVAAILAAAFSCFDIIFVRAGQRLI